MIRTQIAEIALLSVVAVAAVATIAAQASVDTIMTCAIGICLLAAGLDRWSRRA